MGKNKTNNIRWHHGKLSKQDREKQNGHKSLCLWLTGLSGSGKSTIAYKVENELFKRGIKSYVLDGDNVRHGLNKDLGFSPKDRNENIRRIGEVAKLFVDAGFIILTAFISPYKSDRGSVRRIFAKEDFIEIYIKADLETCEERDEKGLYKKARLGEIKDFTGISAPYEPPQNPELTINTTQESNISTNAQKIINFLETKKLI